MSNPNESPAQLRRDAMNAGFWKAVERIECAARGLAVPDDHNPPALASLTFRLVGEINGHVIDVPLLRSDFQPFVQRTEEVES